MGNTLQITITYLLFIVNYNFKPTNTYYIFYEYKHIYVYRCFSKVFQGLQIYSLKTGPHQVFW